MGPSHWSHLKWTEPKSIYRASRAVDDSFLSRERVSLRKGRENITTPRNIHSFNSLTVARYRLCLPVNTSIVKLYQNMLLARLEMKIKVSAPSTPPQRDHCFSGCSGEMHTNNWTCWFRENQGSATMREGSLTNSFSILKPPSEGSNNARIFQACQIN